MVQRLQWRYKSMLLSCSGQALRALWLEGICNKACFVFHPASVHYLDINKHSILLLSNIPRLVVCKVVEVTIPNIEVMRLAHYLTIGSECSTSLSSYLQKMYVDFLPSLHFFIAVFLSVILRSGHWILKLIKTEIVQIKDGMPG